MRTIVKLFGRSPFVALQLHMDKAAACIDSVAGLFEALMDGDFDRVESISAEISRLEHEADRIKNEMRSELPKGMFVPVDKIHLLNVLSIQDSLADKAENIGILLTLKQLEMPEIMKTDFRYFLEKNLAAAQMVRNVVHQLDELLETGFGGAEAEKVRGMIDDVAALEHEADLVQRRIVKTLFGLEGEMSYGSFHLWNQIILEVAALSNISEKLANHIRMTLELR